MRANAPATAEGQAAWAACQSEGVWRQSGVLSPLGATVVCTGLDFDAALRLAAFAWGPGEDFDAGLLAACLKDIEAGRLRGQAKLAETDTETDA